MISQGRDSSTALRSAPFDFTQGRLHHRGNDGNSLDMIDTVAWILRCAQNDQTQRDSSTSGRDALFERVTPDCRVPALPSTSLRAGSIIEGMTAAAST